MRHGWAYIYGSPPATVRLQESIEVLAQNGIYLERPGTGEVARLSDEGDRIVCSEADILKELATSAHVFVQLYLDRDTGVFWSIEELKSQVVRESFGLGGKTETESIFAIRGLINLFSHRTERKTAFALVADRNAELQPRFHWDDFVLGTGEPPEWPLLLGLSTSFPRRNKVPLSYHRAEKDGYVLFTSPDAAARGLETGDSSAGTT